MLLAAGHVPHHLFSWASSLTTSACCIWKRVWWVKQNNKLKDTKSAILQSLVLTLLINLSHLDLSEIVERCIFKSVLLIHLQDHAALDFLRLYRMDANTELLAKCWGISALRFQSLILNISADDLCSSAALWPENPPHPYRTCHCATACVLTENQAIRAKWQFSTHLEN